MEKAPKRDIKTAELGYICRMLNIASVNHMKIVVKGDFKRLCIMVKRT